MFARTFNGLIWQWSTLTEGYAHHVCGACCVQCSTSIILAMSGDHQALLPRVAGINQQGNGCQRAAGHQGGSLYVIQQPVAREEGNKERRGAALIPIHQRMVFDHETQQMGGFLLGRRVDVLPTEDLVYRSDNSIKDIPSFSSGQCIVGPFGGSALPQGI